MEETISVLAASLKSELDLDLEETRSPTPSSFEPSMPSSSSVVHVDQIEQSIAVLITNNLSGKTTAVYEGVTNFIENEVKDNEGLKRFYKNCILERLTRLPIYEIMIPKHWNMRLERFLVHDQDSNFLNCWYKCLSDVLNFFQIQFCDIDNYAFKDFLEDVKSILLIKRALNPNQSIVPCYGFSYHYNKSTRRVEATSSDPNKENHPGKILGLEL